MRIAHSLWPGLVFVVALAALAVGLTIVDRQGEAAIARQQAAIAGSARDYFVAFAREEGVPALAQVLDRRDRIGAPDGFRYAMIDNAGHMLAGADVISSLDVPDKGWSTVVQPDTKSRKLWRVLAQPLGGGRTLIVAEDLSARDALRNAILRGSLAALALTAIGTAGAGMGLNAMLLRRTRGIADTAERIAAGDLSARIPSSDKGDVFDDLTHGLNRMLTRIDELMTGMRTVTDAIAHDLRSPLTRLKGALQRAGRAETEPQRLEALDRAHAELDTVLATLGALLDIARAESGLSRDMMRRTDIAALAVEIAELFAPACEDAGQTLDVDAPAEPVLAWTHETLLRQAVGNLLHNAAIHAGEGAQVRLAVDRPDEHVVRLSITDTGRGIPVDQLGRVQERFIRLEEARTTHGSGLGLALAAACAKLHGGRLMLEDNGPGLRAVLDLAGA